MLSANRITDPISPRRTLRSSEALGDTPEKPTMIRCPSSFEAELGTGVDLAAGLVGVVADGGAAPPDPPEAAAVVADPPPARAEW